MQRWLLLGAAGAICAGACGGSNDTAGATTGAGGHGASSSSSTMSTSSSMSTSTGGTGTGGSGGSARPCSSPLTPDPDVMQALPAKQVDVTFAAPTGKTSKPMSSSDLQAALAAAAPGDVIELDPSVNYVGPFTLPNMAGSGYVIVRTSTPDASLPAAGTRVGPADAPKLAKLTAPDQQPAILAKSGAHHFRFVGLEIAPANDQAMIYELVAFGDGTATTLGDVPHHLILDRSYVHGTPAGYTKRGVQMDCSDCAVVDSFIADCHAVGQDAQAIAGFDGPGPMLIDNNHLEGSGENLMFGGADPAIPNLVPSDLEIRRNHFTKPLTWKADDPSYAGTHWSVKNLLELKNAARVAIHCNVFDQNWADAQVGFSLLLTPRNQDGTAPWSGVSDITISDNVMHDVASGMNMSGEDDLHPSTQTARVVVQNNLLYGLDKTKFGGDGRGFQVITPKAPIQGLKIDHNTLIIANGNAAIVAGDTGPVASTAFLRNNLMSHGDYGVFGSGQGEGTQALGFYFPGAPFEKNAVIGGMMASYPPGNFFPATPADVPFVDFAGGDYHLAATSPLKGAGTDMKDVGANLDDLLNKTKGVAP